MTSSICVYTTTAPLEMAGNETDSKVTGDTTPLLDSSAINDVSSHLDDNNREPTLPVSYGEGTSMLEAFLEKVQSESVESRNHENSPRKMMNAVDSLEVFSDPESDLVTYSGDESEVDDDNDVNSLGSVRHIPKLELPSTVTILDTEHGSKVYIVGTAHFSLESQEDVAKTIQGVKPNIVMVELCNSRVNILQLDEETLLEEAKNINLEKIKLSIKQSGVVQGCLHLLLLSLSAHLTKELGMAPGGEFRRAFKETLNIPGCDFHLGDRPIQVTLRRALQSLSWWQKLRLAWFLITAKEPITKEDVEKCKQKDLLEQMLKEMTGEFPALSRVFVEERDIYLAHSLKNLSKPVPLNEDPEKMLYPIVVGVVGIGHIPGIVNNWDKDCDIKEIMKCPPPSVIGRLFRWTFRASLIGIVFWGCYRLYKWTSLSFT